MSTARKKRQQRQAEKRSPSLKAIRQSRAYAVAKQEIESGERKAAKRQAAQAAQITPTKRQRQTARRAAQSRVAGQLLKATDALMKTKAIPSSKVAKEFTRMFFGLKGGKR